MPTLYKKNAQVCFNSKRRARLQRLIILRTIKLARSHCFLYGTLCVMPKKPLMIFDTEPKNWKELQNYVGQMFEECGFQTEVSKVVDLVRGKKEIDVFAQDLKSEYSPITLIECKYWNKPINQETVHSFRTVVNDFGANIGFIVSKVGFQSGSYEAAEKTNIKLVTLKELEETFYTRWKQEMVTRYLPYADELFPYWDYGGRMPSNREIFTSEKLILTTAAYRPITSLTPFEDVPNGFRRNYPMTIPVINDEYEKVEEKIINTHREYFDFVEEKKDEAIQRFKILFGEISTTHNSI